MTPSRPYLLRALYEWIVDNHLTPYIVVNAQAPDTIVPMEYVRDGTIILNLAPVSVHGLLLGNEAIEFKAKFAGVSRRVYAPIASITAIYARENGRGMVFTPQDMEEEVGGQGSSTGDMPPDDKPPTAGKPTRGKPSLKIVK